MLKKLDSITWKIWGFLPSKNFNEALEKNDKDTLKKEHNIEKVISTFFMWLSLSYFLWFHHITYIDLVNSIEKKIGINCDELYKVWKDIFDKIQNIMDE